MSRHTLVQLMMFAGLILAPLVVKADTLRIVSSEFPPYSFTDDQRLSQGIAVDLVKQLLDELNLQVPIEIYPWARAYEISQRKANTLIFLIARSPEREAHFKWVGPLIDFNVRLFRLKFRSNIAPAQLSDLKQYKVGSLIQDIKGQYLHKQGIPTIEYASEQTGILMLVRGYIDLMPAEINSFRYRVNQLGFDMADFEVALPLHEISRPLYLAFQKDTPDELVVRFRDALTELTATP